jgi:hypothetical protein
MKPRRETSVGSLLGEQFAPADLGSSLIDAFCRLGANPIFWRLNELSQLVPKSEAAEFRAELDVSIARAAVDTSDFGTLSNYLAQNWLAFLLDWSVAVLTWSGSGGLRAQPCWVRCPGGAEVVRWIASRKPQRIP